MRPRITIRDVMRVDPVAGVMGTADDRDEALRIVAERAPSGTSVEQMASAAAEIIRSRVAQRAQPPRVPYIDTFATIEAPEPLLPPEPPHDDPVSPTAPDPVEPRPEPGDDAPPEAPARPTKPRR